MIGHWVERVLIPLDGVTGRIWPLRHLSLLDRFKKARANSAHFKLTTPNLWRFSIGLAVYQAIFAFLFIFMPSTITETPVWDRIAAILPNWVQGAIYLFLCLVMVWSVPSHNKFAIHLVVISQSAIWLWWASIFFIVSTSGAGTITGAVTYGFLVMVCSIITKGLTEDSAS